MAGQDRPHVLQAQVPLQHGLEEVAQRGDDADKSAESGCLGDIPGPDQRRQERGGDNDLTARPSRYYFSQDFGYALWLRLYLESSRFSSGDAAIAPR